MVGLSLKKTIIVIPVITKLGGGSALYTSTKFK